MINETLIIEKCPYCEAAHVQTTLQWMGSSREKGEWLVLRCQNRLCQRLILQVRKDKEINQVYPLGNFQLETKVLVPTMLREDFQEAGACLAAGCFKASLVMSRRALQRCLKEQDCNQRNLVDAIDAAINNGILRKSFHNLAEEIRHYGNLGAHPDDDQLKNANREAALQVLEFTRLLIHEFYEVPAAAAKLKGNRGKTA